MPRIPSAGGRFVACVVLPRLPVQAELLRRPELARSPVVIAWPAHAQPTVAACSSLAEACGLCPGMPLREVLPTCRETVVLPADPEHYAAVHDALLAALEERVPAVEPGGGTCAYADLTGMQRLYPEPMRLLHVLAGAAPPGFSCAVAAGPNKFVAHVAAHTADPGAPVLVPAGNAATFLAPHGVHHLPVSEEAQRRLELFGLKTLGQVAEVGIPALQEQFGPEGRIMGELSQGIDETPVIPRRPFRPISESLTPPAPLVEWEAFWAAVRQLLYQLWNRQERGGVAVRQLQLLARVEGGETWEKTITLHAPVGTLERLANLMRFRLQGAVLPGAIEALTVRLTLLGGECAVQESLFAAIRGERLRKLRAAAERLRARHGVPLLHRIVEVEPWSRIPERRYALINFEA